MSEADDIDAQVAALEARSGVQVATAIVGKTDSYSELPWKAFALGASLAGLAVVAADVWRPQWVTAGTAIAHVTTILASGGTCALAAIFIPAFARIFLRPSRRDVEVRQYAESLFLKHGLFATRDRTAVLILITIFERRIEILHDVGLADLVSENDWNAVIARMTPHMREWRPHQALQQGLLAVGDLLASKGFAGAGGRNELPDSPIEERGE